MSELKITEAPVKVIRRFHLDLSEEEAAALFVVINRVGGDPNISPRGLINNFHTQLSGRIDRKLVRRITSCLKKDCDQRRGTLYFRDNTWDMNKEGE